MRRRRRESRRKVEVDTEESRGGVDRYKYTTTTTPLLEMTSQSVEYLFLLHHQTLPPNRPFNGINCHFTHHNCFSIPPKPKFKSVSANLNQNPTLQSSYDKNTSTQLHVHSKDLQSSYSSLIQDCISSNSFDKGKSIHARMLAENGFTPDTYLQTKILMLYARAGGLSELNIARKLFDEMPERNSTSWNTMILGYARFDDHKEVLEMFFRMFKEGISPDKFTFPSVVRAFVALEDCDGFWEVQSLIIKFGLNRNLVVGGSLVDGFVSFGSIDDAATAFDEMDEKNVISWNALLRGYVKAARWEEAWRIFYKMLMLGESPDHFTFATAIRVCGSLRSLDLDRGKQVHAKLIVFGFADDVFVGNSLIDMYAKCRDLRCCLKVFDQMREKDQVTWNSMISGEVQFGHFSEALMLFSKMQMLGYEIDRFNLTSALAACSGLADGETGQELHAYLVRHLLDSDVIFGSALVDMYSKCGCVEKAHQAFERLAERNEVSWNSLLSGYVQMGQLEEALEIYHELTLAKNVRPDRFTFTSLLNLFAHHGNIDQGKQIHAHIIRTVGTDHLVVETELVHMYAKCGSLNYAQDIFNRMAERNSYSWNSLIEGYEQNEHPEKSLQLFLQMQLVGIKPDCFSLTSSLSACSSLSNIKKGKELHGFIVRNYLERQGILGCVLVDMYAKCKFLDCAYKIYSRTNEKDVGIQNVMVSAFVGCGKIEDAMQVFDQMEERNTISWNSVLFGCANSDSKGETFKLFGRMQEENIEFDSQTLVILFNLCASLTALAQGEQLHVLAIKRGLLNTSVIMDSALVDMYAKCGSIGQARKVFDKMKVKNVISWNAMINGYAKHGFSEDVLVLYELMQKEEIYPNSITFLSVLSACSHTGRIEEGLRIFISMLEDHRFEAKAEHYTCMVDLLGRVGRLDEAKEVIERMPVKPEVSTWGALLGACRVHENVELGKIAADRLFDMDPQNPGHYVLMSNIYARAGKWKEVEEVRNLMRLRGVTKDPGTSWIEINNEIQTFHAGAQYHPRTKEIYTTLRCLSLQMKGLGYIPDTKFVLRNVDEVEEEEYLMQHSERLAMALGLISLPRRSIIRVFKNLRICGDCHTAAKFISKITSRKIIIRDTNRFHHFENGMCSCGDFW